MKTAIEKSLLLHLAFLILAWVVVKVCPTPPLALSKAITIKLNFNSAAIIHPAIKDKLQNASLKEIKPSLPTEQIVKKLAKKPEKLFKKARIIKPQKLPIKTKLPIAKQDKVTYPSINKSLMIEKKKSILVKAKHVVTPNKDVRPMVKHTHPYDVATKVLDSLNPSEIPMPALKELPKTKAAVLTQMNNEQLANKYANLIGDCIKNNLNLVALGPNRSFNILAHFYLGRDKNLKSIAELNVDGGDKAQQEIVKNQTILALKACTPFDLPIEKYDIWKEVNMRFSPNNY